MSANPTFRNAVESHNTNSSSMVITAPTNVAGDIMVVGIAGGGPGGLGVNTLAGWTLVNSFAVASGGSMGGLGVYAKLSVGGETSWTFTSSTSVEWHAIAASYYNVSQTVPVDTGASATAHASQTSANASLLVGTITTTEASNEVAVAFVCYENNSSLTPNAAISNVRNNTYDSAASGGIGASLALLDGQLSSIGSTGAMNCTITAAKSLSVSFALVPVLTTPEFWTTFVNCAEVDS